MGLEGIDLLLTRPRENQKVGWLDTKDLSGSLGQWLFTIHAVVVSLSKKIT
jgi:hypothetical protein